MVRAVIGLGNPLPEYAGTRHNLGRMAVEALRERESLEWRSHFWNCYRWCRCGGGMLLAVSKTYMNCSGEAALALAGKFGLKPEEILVLLDDCALPLGKLRYRRTGSAGGHNGLKSVLEALGTQDVPRLRMGIGMGSLPLAEHVLGEFDPDERETVKSCTAFVSEALAGLSEEEDKTINAINNWRAPSYGDASKQEVIP